MDVYTSECYDSVALFLCIHIIHRYKVIMHQRNAPVLDKSAPHRYFCPSVSHCISVCLYVCLSVCLAVTLAFY